MAVVLKLLTVCLMLLAASPASAQQWRSMIVVNPKNTIGYTKGDFPNSSEVALPYGTLVQRVKKFGVAFEVTYKGASGRTQNLIVRSRDVKSCSEAGAGGETLKYIQHSLNGLGYDAGPADNQMGPRTRNAIRKFFRTTGIDPNDLSLGCQKALIQSRPFSPLRSSDEKKFREELDLLLVPEGLRRQWEMAKRAFEELKCEDLKNLPSFVTKDFSQQTCFEVRERKTQTQLAETLFDQRRCDELGNIAEAYRKDFSVSQCTTMRALEKDTRLFRQAISNQNCDAAAAISAKINKFANEVVKCRAAVQRQAAEEALAFALASNDCQAIKSLEASLGLGGGFETCQFSIAMASETAREMFFAASKYELGNDVARAKLVYSELMERFPEDRFAEDAITRLVLLNDMERSDKARREMEAEMARLKREAEAAQRKAEEARRQAERARAEAERRAAASVPRRTGPCARFSVGYFYTYGVQAFGLNLPQGDARVIELNYNTGMALVQFLPAASSSYTQQVRCSNIPLLLG